MKKAVLILIALLLTTPVSTLAAGISLIRGQDTAEGFYRYEFPNGPGFLSTVLDGEKDAVIAAFDFEEGISWSLTKDGESYNYQNNDILDKGGSYTMSLRASDSSDEPMEATLSFSVTSDTVNFPSLEDFVFQAAVNDAPLRLTGFSNGMFTYEFETLQSFRAEVPNGGTADRPVAFEFDEKLTYSVACDGKSIDYDGFTPFVNPGVYDITIVSQSDMSSSQTVEDLLETPVISTGTYISTFHFRILAGRTNQMRIYNAPQDFIIESLTLGGRSVSHGDRSAALNSDGVYEIALRCETIPSLSNVIRIGADYSPPVLQFSYGFANETYEKIRISAPPDCALTAMRENEPYTIRENALSQTGQYKLYASDAAGNTRVYTVRIIYGIEVTFTGVLILAACLAGALALIVFILRFRTNVR